MNYRKILYNPFVYVAGYQALIIGVIGVLLISILNYITGTHFNGLLNIDYAKDCDYWVYLVENILHFGLLSVFLYLYTRFFTATNVRLIDVVGTLLVARIPLIIVPLCRLFPYFESFVINSLTMYLLSIIYLVSLIWSTTLLYNAFKVSCNLKDSKLIITLITTLVLTEIFTKSILYLIL